jgi:DUF1680 family protein
MPGYETRILLLGALAMTVSADAYQPAVKPAVAVKAEAFPPDAVRLLDGPFKRALDLNSRVLLAFEPDRFLSRFREYAGLKPRAKVYGGWESMTISGHSLGHYLSACALTFAATGDARFRDRVSYMVDELEAVQAKNGDGYVAGFPDGRRVFREVAAGDIRSQGFDLNGCWVPFYTLHKLFAGLRDAYRILDNRKALDISVRLAGWVEKTLSGLNEDQMQKVLACEHGGMNEVLADLYADTGEKRWLALSRRFNHKAVLDPLVRGEDRLNGLHANTQVPKLIGLARRYEIAGDPADLKAAAFFWDRIAHHHSYVTGSNSDGEHLGEPDRLSDRLGENTAETCNVYNMLKLTRELFMLEPAADKADFYERALYNHILASQDPETGAYCYYATLMPGAHKKYSGPEDFWCCVGSGMENHARYGEAVYFHDSDGIWVNLFIASELDWKDREVVLRQETAFPESGSAKFTFRCARPVRLTLRVRRPCWTAGMKAMVNGHDTAITPDASGYAEITREWKTGDAVEIILPMSLRQEAMPDNPERTAFLCGPAVLAGDLGPADDPKAGDPDYVPVLVTAGRPLNDWLKPAEGKPLTFRTDGTGRPRDATLYPVWLTGSRRYTVYWDLFTPARWDSRQAEYRAERERQARLVAATVDSVVPAMQSERDHGMKGENTEAGTSGPHDTVRHWRHAYDGWFSYELEVPPDRPVVLVCTYWGSDVGDRTFDILVEGVRVGTETLDNDRPGKFFDVTYSIPEDLTRGKHRVTVRFQSHPRNLAGGVFEARIVRKEALK